MKIICVGRNYTDHAKELGNSTPKEPVIFCKPDSAILQPRNPFVIPPWTKEVHHELELIMRIGKVGKYIEPKYALSYVDSISVGIDFTARDIQSELKKAGLPWEKAKGFDGSAAIGRWIKGSPNKKNYEIQLFKNNDLVQKGNTRDFIFSIEELICYISQFFTLKSGDIIFTGTPSGVASIEAGDELICKLDGNSLLSLSIR
ncbi:MAG: fumarylacetoacetate hydrolase family protein [Schleiferiaceae bacterium]|jgi:2-keto-4-pentenoate hydratase/2-oxohepta-3-ene-1,7-dioic acid hydratase in catechol pathway|tara:strand:- start:19542 stop:20147 length:606 start_codon:yes stop_codon:yes gene_type:complete